MTRIKTTNVGTGIVDDTEFNRINGVTSDIQTQITAVASSSGLPMVSANYATPPYGGGKLMASGNSETSIYTSLPVQNPNNTNELGYAIWEYQFVNNFTNAGALTVYMANPVFDTVSNPFSLTTTTSVGGEQRVGFSMGFPYVIYPGVNQANTAMSFFNVGGLNQPAISNGIANQQTGFLTFPGYTGFNTAKSDTVFFTSSAGSGYEDVIGCTATINVSASSKILVLVSMDSIGTNNNGGKIQIADSSNTNLKQVALKVSANFPPLFFHLTGTQTAGSKTIKLRFDPMSAVNSLINARIFLMEIPSTAIAMSTESISTPTVTESTVASLSGISYAGYKRFLLLTQATGKSDVAISTDVLQTRFASFDGSTETLLNALKTQGSNNLLQNLINSHAYITNPLASVTEFRLKANKSTNFSYTGEEFAVIEMPDR